MLFLSRNPASTKVGQGVWIACSKVNGRHLWLYDEWWCKASCKKCNGREPAMMLTMCFQCISWWFKEWRIYVDPYSEALIQCLTETRIFIALHMHATNYSKTWQLVPSLLLGLMTFSMLACWSCVRGCCSMNGMCKQHMQPLIFAYLERLDMLASFSVLPDE